jgi:hypothetical protein
MSLTKVSYSMVNGAPFNVLDYGAVGNGTTDDTAAIQAAINAAYANGGGQVYFPARTYKITSTLTLKSNIRYQGEGTASFYPSSPATQKGATLVWAGNSASTIYMVECYNTWAVIWDGISFLGDWTYGSSSEVRAINIATNTATVVDANSQRNYISNFSIQKCKYGVSFGGSFSQTAGNVDGWIVEKFIIDVCDTGIYLNCINIAYAEIRNGLCSTTGPGVFVNYSNWIKIDSLALSGQLGSTTNTGLITLTQNAGAVTISNSQAEVPGSTGYYFVIFVGGIKYTPTTFIGNSVDLAIKALYAQKSLTFIGNQIFTYVYLDTQAGSNVVSINDYVTAPGGAFQSGSVKNNISITYGDGNGTFTPTLLKGSTPITATTATGSWVRKGQTVYIEVYLFVTSGSSSASGNYTIGNLPFYSSIDGILSYFPVGNFTINGVDYAKATPHFLAVSDDAVSAILVGTNADTNWTSNSFTIGFSGTYQVPNYPTSNP